MHDYDFLIVGSGIAGLYAALLATHSSGGAGSVALITKGPVEESNTKYAQGGIAAAVGPGDTASQHFADTREAGAGLCVPAAVQVMVRDAPDRIRRLTELGVPWDTQQGGIALGNEAAHSQPRILHAGGARTGDAIETVMVDRVRQAGVEVLDRHAATSLLVEDGCCVGARTRRPDGSTLDVLAARTILATGGAGQLYTLTTNPEVATGDGVALAFRAGAAVRDMEFVQFHPTALRLPGVPTFLISEALRGEGAILRNREGQRFMPRYHTRGELAARDIVARAIVNEMNAAGSPYVWLDVSHLDPDHVAARFPGIHQYCLRYEIDITREPIPVAPAAHYMMGGVATDLWGRTTLPGLLACGEVANTGVHGANRLASNSLLETVVFAQRAVEADAGTLAIDAVRLELPADAAPTDREALQTLLWDSAGIVRDGGGLRSARGILDGLRDNPNHDSKGELTNMTLYGRLIIEAALRREESRGAHFRADFPDTQSSWARSQSFEAAR